MSRMGEEVGIDQMELCNISPDPREFDPNSNEIQLRELKDVHEDCGYLFFRLTREHAALKAQLANEEKTTDRLRAGQTKDRKEIEILRKELETFKNELNIMKKEKETFKTDKEKSDADFLAVKRERNEIEKKKIDLEKFFEEKCKSYKEKIKYVETLHECAKKKHFEETSKQKKINEILERELQKEKSANGECATELETLRRSVHEQNLEFNQHKNDIEAKFDFFSTQAEKLKVEIQRLTETLSDREKELENERSLTKNLRSEIDSLKKGRLNAKSVMQNNLALLRKDLETLRADLPNNLNSCFSDFAEKYTSKTSSFLNDCHKKRDDFQNSFEQLMASNLIFGERAQEATARSQKIEKRNKLLESELAVQKKLVVEHEDKISTLKEQLEAAKSAGTKLELKTPSPETKKLELKIPTVETKMSPPVANSVEEKKQSLKRLMPSPTVSYADDVFLPNSKKKRPKTELDFLRREIEYHREETIKHQKATHQLNVAVLEKENENVQLKVELDKKVKQIDELCKSKDNLLENLVAFVKQQGRQQIEAAP